MSAGAPDDLLQVMRQMPDAACLKDGDGRWVDLNRPARLLLGLEPGQVQGRTDEELARLFPGRAGFFQACAQHTAEAWRRRHPIRAAMNVEVGSGEHDLELTLLPVHDARGGRSVIFGMVRNVTHRVRTEEALRASELRFRQIFQTNAISMWEEDMSAARLEVERLRATGVTDLRNYLVEHPEFATRCAALVRVVDVNAATLRMFRAHSKEELLGSLARVFTPATLECFINAFIAMLEGVREVTCETVNRTLAGDEVHVLMMVSAAEYGGPDRVLISMIDITARKRMEQALKRSQASLAEAQQLARLGNWDWNIVEGTTEWSTEVFRIFGLAPGSYQPTYERFLHLVHPADRDRVEAQLKRALVTGNYEIEYRILRRGEVAVLQEYARVLRDSEGRPIRMVGTVQDVTEVRRKEALGARLGRIMDRSSNEIFVFDPETLQFLQVNQGAQRNLGYTAEEFLRMTPMDLDVGVEADVVRSHVELLRSGAVEQLQFEVDHHRRDGSTYPAEIRLHYSADEEPPVVVAIVQDITQRRAVERMKAEFLATVSHELRTPLTAMRGALSLLAGGFAGEKSGELLDIAVKNSERLLLLINDLLDLQTLESGAMEFRMEKQDLMSLVEQAIAMNHGYAALFGVRVRIAQTLPGAQVRVDGTRLLQVLANLLSNAAKFSPEGGEVEVSVQREGRWVRVRVTDQGEGVPEEFIPHLFEKFAQADKSNSRLRGGTGLGLSISRELVEAMGGQIGFGNLPGKGASFYFDLPLLHEAD